MRVSSDLHDGASSTRDSTSSVGSSVLLNFDAFRGLVAGSHEGFFVLCDNFEQRICLLSDGMERLQRFALFFSQITHSLRFGEPWKNASSDEWLVLLNHFERWLQLRFCKQLLPVDEMRDSLLFHRIASLCWLKPKHMEIAREHWNEMVVTNAAKDLARLDIEVTAFEMFSIVQKAVRNVLRMIGLQTIGAVSPGADDFFPIWCIVVIRSRSKRLVSNLELMQQSRDILDRDGEWQCCATHLEAAMHFIQLCNGASFGMEEQEFQQLLDRHSLPKTAPDKNTDSGNSEQLKPRSNSSRTSISFSRRRSWVGDSTASSLQPNRLVSVTSSLSLSSPKVYGSPASTIGRRSSISVSATPTPGKRSSLPVTQSPVLARVQSTPASSSSASEGPPSSSSSLQRQGTGVACKELDTAQGDPSPLAVSDSSSPGWMQGTREILQQDKLRGQAASGRGFTPTRTGSNSTTKGDSMDEDAPDWLMRSAAKESPAQDQIAEIGQQQGRPSSQGTPDDPMDLRSPSNPFSPQVSKRSADWKKL